LVQLAIAAVVRGLHGWARYGSFEEAGSAAVGTIATVVLLAGAGLATGRGEPTGALLTGGALALVVQAGLRWAYRRVWEYRRSPRDGVRHRAVVIGAGEGGDQILRAMLRNPDSAYLPVALLDDDPAKEGLRIMAVPVAGGREQLAEQVSRHGADTLLVAIPSAGPELIRELVDLAAPLRLDVKVLPSVAELPDGVVRVADIRPVNWADLLGRREIRTDIEAIAGYLTGKRVLVTGAGGSIGSQLCQEIARFGPEQLVMLDRDESGLHGVQLRLEGRALLSDSNLVVADIRDAARLHEVFAEHRPDVVFHAAALKHLPLLELHPAEAVKTNVQGTQHVLDAALAAGVRRVVNISTDKAVDPTSVLGWSKRIGERLTAAAAASAPDGASYLSVRFGNVLGSRGSIMPAFQAQLEAGGPLTVTHPEVTRYFMTVEEAVRLVVQAGAIGRPGEALVLDMGQPVRIADVARRLAASAPRPVEITFTGLRPGEKLHESLFGVGESDERPVHPMIAHVPVPPLAVAQLAALSRAATREDCAAALRTVCALPAAEQPERGAESAPLTTRRIYLSPPDTGELERKMLLAAFDSGWIAPAGPDLDAFEEEVAARVGVAHAVALSSGTAALHLALIGAGVGAGDTVLVPSFTFAATASAVLYLGARPVFVDSCAESWNADPQLVSDELGRRARTGDLPRAVIAVDMYGQCADYGPLAATCARYGVPLVEDAAEALGATYRGRQAGSFGTAAVLSFNGNKIITTGGGGMLLTGDRRIARRARHLATQAREPVLHYEHREVGYNYRLSNLLAAVGRAQLQGLDERVAARRATAQFYRDALGDLPGISFMPNAGYGEPTWWLTCLLVDPLVAGASRDEILGALAADGIEARPAWKPMHLQPAYRRYEVRGGAVSERLFAQGLCLPSGSGLSAADRQRVAGAVRAACTRRAPVAATVERAR
ncbi:MAG: polysaccharide biosynthesis protein, partial [Actinomycetia bacterium]|nr:polysaccharide biosynthesis protein [Actinomycetes bacterium]